MASAISAKANGNGGVYFRYITPREFNTASTLTSIVASYPEGSLIIISIGWEEYQSFPYAGCSGYIMIGATSCRAWGTIRNYSVANYSVAFTWTDAIDVSRYSGLYSI